jgi:glutamate racemase
VGGLSILREIRRQLPFEDILYLADQGHVPYGPRPLDEIRAFSHAITRFFLQRDAKAVVVACNAASAASLHALRKSFPDTPFVGMEPAVKPAVLNSRSGVIGVLTTKATNQGELFASVIDRFAAGVRVETQVCPEFVTLVERGELESEAAIEAVRAALAPLLAAGADQLVLGCTHFPFLAPTIARIAGPDVDIVDPSAAVARQVGRVTAACRNASPHTGQVAYFTSGDPVAFHALAGRLMGEPVAAEQVRAVSWSAGEVVLAGA